MTSTTKSDLADLEASGLIRLAQIVPELEYIFRHALVQDAVYNTLLNEDRRRIHRAVGQTIEEIFDGKQDEYSSVLARHYEAAGEIHKALEYHKKAGDLSASIYANAEAIFHYKHALAIASDIKEYSSTLLDICTKLGRVLELNADFNGALEHYEDMEELGRRRDEPRLTLVALMGSATLRASLSPVHDRELGRELNDKSLKLAQTLDDQEAQVAIMWNLSNTDAFYGKLSQAIEWGEQALALARQLESTEQVASILNDLSYGYLSRGPLELAKEYSIESCQLWRASGNLPMLTNSLSTLGGVYDAMGEHEQGLARGEEALEIGHSIENQWAQAFARVIIGFSCNHLGLYGRAVENLEESLRISDSINLKVVAVYAHSCLSSVYTALGEHARGIVEAEGGLLIAESDMPYMVTYVTAILAQAHLYRGDLAEAERTVQRCKIKAINEERIRFDIMLGIIKDEMSIKAGRYLQAKQGSEKHLSTLKNLNLKSLLPRVLYCRAQALQALGEIELAYELLEEAYELAVAMRARPLLWPVLALLSYLEAEGENWQKAEKLKAEARAIVSDIATETPEHLRIKFLQLPTVSALVDPSQKRKMNQK
jgi:tetratricopeptide (TPR) repeat protein